MTYLRLIAEIEAANPDEGRKVLDAFRYSATDSLESRRLSLYEDTLTPLQRFAQAAMELRDALPEGEITGYPFGKCFREITADVLAWRDANEGPPAQYEAAGPDLPSHILTDYSFTGNGTARLLCHGYGVADLDICRCEDGTSSVSVTSHTFTDEMALEQAIAEFRQKEEV